MAILAGLLTFAALILSPHIAAKVMRLEGGLGKAAIVAFVTLGAIQIIAMVAPHLGPFGGILGFMASLATWYQVVKVVYGTDMARTIVFMFWHLFFQILFVSLLALLLGPDRISWVWGG